MYIANILAGGTGTRMQMDTPKQFLDLNKKPILIHSIETFVSFKEFKYIVIATPKVFLEETKKLVEEYITDERIIICEGGNNRTNSIINSISKIKELENTDNFRIVTHDAARPLVTKQIIKSHINNELKVINTVIESTDTIIESLDSKTINSITNRKNMFHVQTPQTFNANEFVQLVEKYKTEYSDACSLFAVEGIKVNLVDGSKLNMKITTKEDLLMLESLIKG